MRIDNKRIMVIGGAGLIGSHTVDQLIEENVKEIIIYDNMTRGTEDNLKEALKDNRVRIYDVGGDILQTDILNSAMKNIDGVFNCCIVVTTMSEYPRSAFNVNIAGAFNVIEACVNNNIKKIVYSSSASVYGTQIIEPMDEKHPFNKNFYGATKIASEAIEAFHHRHGLNYVGLKGI